jgi:hypothetical protein
MQSNRIGLHLKWLVPTSIRANFVRSHAVTRYLARFVTLEFVDLERTKVRQRLRASRQHYYTSLTAPLFFVLLSYLSLNRALTLPFNRA